MSVNFDVEGFQAYVRAMIGSQTQRAFAKARGLTPEHLSRMLNASCPPVPTVRTLKKLAGGNMAAYQDLLAFVGHRMVPYVHVTLPVISSSDPITAHDYQSLAARTINPNLTKGQIKAHALWGLASEVGELQGLYQKAYQGHKIDSEHAKKEVGDICWMIAEYCTAQGWDLGDVMQLNIDKLKARYPEGFDADHSLHRKEGDV